MRNLAFSLLFCAAQGFGQIPVTDAAANANLVLIESDILLANGFLEEILAIQTAAKGEAAQTTGNTMNTLQEAQKMREMLEKVNDAVSSAKIVGEIWGLSREIIQLTFDIQRALNGTDRIGEKNKRHFINTATDLMNRSQPLLELANMVLTPGTLKATDTERIRLLMDIHRDLRGTLEDLEAFKLNTLTLNGVSLERIKG